MRTPIVLPRIFALLLFGAGTLWIVCPAGLDASHRTYTAEYVPDRIADGFDFPVGRSGSAAGYYMARRMTPFNHLGDDWNGVGGGNSDYGDPVYSIADGVVVYSQNFGSNWGEVLIVRHRYRDHDGRTKMVDSLYGHVIHRRVAMGDAVRRGQQIAQIGNNNGMYLAHLHLEVRSNTSIGIQSWNHSKGLSNYHRPHQFIAEHRPGALAGPRPVLASASPKGPETPAVPVKEVAAPGPSLVASVTPQTSRMAAPVSRPPAFQPDRVVAAPRSAPAPKSAVTRVVDTEDRRTVEKRKLFEGSESRAGSRRVVDELGTVDRDGVRNGSKGLFHFASFSPERDRRSRKPASEPVKGILGKRKKFGKQ